MNNTFKRANTQVRPYNKSDSPEVNLLLACCKCFIVNENSDSLIRFAQNQNIDWKTFFWLSDYHRVVPLVYQAIKSNQNFFPHEVVQTLSKNYNVKKMKSLQKTAELITILTQFDKNEIPVMPLKGNVLSFYLYGDPTVRSSSDIDLFLPKNKLIQAESILEQTGYISESTQENINEFFHSRLIRTLKHSKWRHPKTHILVELHWSLAEPRQHWAKAFADTFAFDCLYPICETINLTGRSIRIMPDDYLFIALAVHGSSHAWYRLMWVCDVVTMLTKFNLDSDKISHMLDKMQLKPILQQTLLLVQTLFDINISHRFSFDSKKAYLHFIRYPQQLILNLSSSETIGLHDESEYLDLRVSYYNIQCYKTLAGKIRYLTESFLPTSDDIRKIPLPKFLYPLYIIIRPMLLLKRIYRYFSKKNKKFNRGYQS